ncbi:MAG: translation initiation factor IF-2 [Patescibacteria group bacterium]
MKKVIVSQTRRRPPVVVVVGHIDHGKSTLLDYIRQTKVAAAEPGGITQRVSAYEVKQKREENGSEETITFLDTPGHEAFSELRERSVSIADLAIVVVSAEEGVKAQTIEALKAVTNAGLPYLIAINKIDRPTANVDQTKQGLAENGILVEGYGGTIPSLPISAKTGEGVPELLELILLMADLAELTEEPEGGKSGGFVLETTKHPKAGIVATLIIKSGEVRPGDFLVVGSIFGRIKKLENFRGENVSALTASSPAVVLGLPEMPPSGAAFVTATDKNTAEALARQSATEKNSHHASRPETEDGVTELPLILKADNQGSLEAIVKEVKKLETATMKFSILHRGLGQITENDVKLGTGTKPAVIVGFNVTADRSVREIAEKYGLMIKTFDIIYHLSEWLAGEMIRQTPVVEVEETVGEIRVLKIFSHEKNRQIIGATATQGAAAVRQPVRIMRRGTLLGEGEIIELKRQKLEIKKVETEEPFGALVESKIAIAPGDTLLVFARRHY